MSNWYDDKTKVKDLFDSIRNYILCGVVLYSGMWLVTNEAKLSFFKLRQ